MAGCHRTVEPCPGNFYVQRRLQAAEGTSSRQLRQPSCCCFSLLATRLPADAAAAVSAWPVALRSWILRGPAAAEPSRLLRIANPLYAKRCSISVDCAQRNTMLYKKALMCSLDVQGTLSAKQRAMKATTSGSAAGLLVRRSICHRQRCHCSASEVPRAADGSSSMAKSSIRLKSVCWPAACERLASPAASAPFMNCSLPTYGSTRACPDHCSRAQCHCRLVHMQASWWQQVSSAVSRQRSMKIYLLR